MWTQRGEESEAPRGQRQIFSGRSTRLCKQDAHPAGTPGPRPAPSVLEMVQSVLCTREAAGADDPGPRDRGEGQPGVLTWSAQWQDPGEGLGQGQPLCPVTHASVSHRRSGDTRHNPCRGEEGQPAVPTALAPANGNEDGCSKPSIIPGRRTAQAQGGESHLY